MSKKKNKSGKNKNPQFNATKNVSSNVDSAVVNASPETENVVMPSDTASVTDNKDGKDKTQKGKVVEVKAKDVKKKKDKPKKPNKMVTALKNTGSELKKITWPKFKDVVKQTGIVLVVVLVFALVVFGLDRLCSWLTGFLY